MTDQIRSTGAQSFAPRCTIIVPTRDKLHYLKACIDGVLATTDPETTDVMVVDNNSREPGSLDYLRSLEKRPNCRVLKWEEAFNFSAINNHAVEKCQSELVCFLNNDIEIRDPEWLRKLLLLAGRKDVGAAGALLCYPDGTIQHAGIELDEFSIACHVGLREDHSLVTGRHPYATAAVTAACLVMRREIFQRLGGFNAEQLAVAFNDVDLCLRLGDKGLPVLLHPGVTLVHHESISRQSDLLPGNRARARREHDYMLFRWQHRLTGERACQSLVTYLNNNATAQAGSLDEAIAMATDQLYREKPVPTRRVEPVTEDSTGAADSYWHDQYQRLERSYQSLQAHAGRVERAHQLIERSIFWRMTGPLRSLRDRVRGVRAPESLPADSNGLMDAGGSAAGRKTDDVKQAYDRQAAAQLEEFLAGEDTLDFQYDAAPRLSVVLVLYNRADLSLLCLRSLLNQKDVPLELIIVDNQSSDETDALLAQVRGATIIRNQDNKGFVLAVNQGARRAGADYLLLLNNDAVLENEALANALKVMDADQGVGALGGQIRLLDGTLQEAGSIIFNDGACTGYGRGRRPDDPEFMFRRDVDYCSGAFLLLRRQQFLEMGGFDEDYAPAYYEESDYCVRLWNQGYRVVYEPSCRIDHYEFASSGSIKDASSLQSRHRDVLCRKHPDYLQNKYANDPDNILQARISNRRPRVLVIDDRVPHPSLGAGYPRCAHILKVLSELPLNVTFYPLLYPNDDWQEVYSTLPATIEVMLGLGEPGLQWLLQQRQDYFDIIMISRAHNMEVFKHLLDREPELAGDSRIIYDAEAVFALREAARVRLIGGAVSEQAEQEMIRREMELARPADHIVAVSGAEAVLFERHGYPGTTVVGHVMEPSPNPRGFQERSGLLFVGALRDEGSPNVDSLLWFVINVWPRIEQALPGISLTVVGDNTAASLAAIDSDAIQFTGRLESIDGFYDSHRLFLAPTRFAAGVPHKIHEAAGKGIPAVATTLLAGQLGWRDGGQLLAADTADDFAAACIRLYQEEELWQSIQQNALRSVAEDCSEVVFRNALARLFVAD